MANMKSAAKRARQNVRKNSVNTSFISSVKTAVKAFKTAVAEKGKTPETLELFKAAQSRLMKAASNGMLHKNNAERRVSRLSDLLKKKAN